MKEFGQPELKPSNKPETENLRDRIEVFQSNVRDQFEKKLAEIFDRIGQNPYFQSLNDRSF